METIKNKLDGGRKYLFIFCRKASMVDHPILVHNLSHPDHFSIVSRTPDGHAEQGFRVLAEDSVHSVFVSGILSFTYIKMYQFNHTPGTE
jgi:hypothetical protein